MEYIATVNGRVGHIVSGVFPGTESRMVTTVCGKTYPEYKLTVNNDLDVCSACEGKEEKLVEAVPDVVLEPEEIKPEPVVEEKPTATTKKK